MGRVAALANAELRWTFVQFRAIGQGFDLMVVPFADAGRTFDRVAATSLSDYTFGRIGHSNHESAPHVLKRLS